MSVREGLEGRLFGTLWDASFCNGLGIDAGAEFDGLA